MTDAFETTRSDADDAAVRFLARLGADARCLEVVGVAAVAFPVGLFARDRAGRFPVLIA